MDYRDTVLSQKEIDIIDKVGVVNGDIVPYLNRQAEITWGKAIREVVEFVMGQEQDDGVDTLHYFVISKDKWQSKLKEWGVENA